MDKNMCAKTANDWNEIQCKLRTSKLKVESFEFYSLNRRYFGCGLITKSISAQLERASVLELVNCI